MSQQEPMYGHELMEWMLKEAFKATGKEFKGAIVLEKNGPRVIHKSEEFGQWIIERIGLDNFKKNKEVL